MDLGDGDTVKVFDKSGTEILTFMTGCSFVTTSDDGATVEFDGSSGGSGFEIIYKMGKV